MRGVNVSLRMVLWRITKKPKIACAGARVEGVASDRHWSPIHDELIGRVSCGAAPKRRGQHKARVSCERVKKPQRRRRRHRGALVSSNDRSVSSAAYLVVTKTSSVRLTAWAASSSSGRDKGAFCPRRIASSDNVAESGARRLVLLEADNAVGIERQITHHRVATSRPHAGHQE